MPYSYLATLSQRNSNIVVTLRQVKNNNVVKIIGEVELSGDFSEIFAVT